MLNNTIEMVKNYLLSSLFKWIKEPLQQKLWINSLIELYLLPYTYWCLIDRIRKLCIYRLGQGPQLEFVVFIPLPRNKNHVFKKKKKRNKNHNKINYILFDSTSNSLFCINYQTPVIVFKLDHNKINVAYGSYVKGNFLHSLI